MTLLTFCVCPTKVHLVNYDASCFYSFPETLSGGFIFSGCQLIPFLKGQHLRNVLRECSSDFTLQVSSGFFKIPKMVIK